MNGLVTFRTAKPTWDLHPTAVVSIPESSNLLVSRSTSTTRRLSVRAFSSNSQAVAMALSALSATTIVALLFAACATQQGGIELDDIAVMPTAETSHGTPSSGANSAISDQPTSGGTLKVMFACLESLDPVIGDCHALFDEVYARLVTLADDPAMPVAPDLAEFYQVSDDGKTYTFTLRRDLKFSDGSPLSALDFKWSWERALNADSGSINARTALGLIVGANEVASGESDELRGVEVPDDRTLRVHLTAPSGAFLFNVADHVATPLKRANVEAWGTDVQGFPRAGDPNAASRVRSEATGPGVLPIGTGPFRFSEGSITGPENMKIERNPFTHGPAPHLDGVEYVKNWIKAYSEWELNLADRMFALYLSGAIDIAHFAHPDAVSDDGQNYIRNLPQGVVFLAFNTDIPPFDDVDVRRALVAATDVAGVQEGGEALSVMWPGVPGYVPELSVNRFDPEHDFQPADGRDLRSLGPFSWCIWSNESGDGFVRAYVEPHFGSWQDATGLRASGDGTSCYNPPTDGVIHVYIRLLYADPYSIFEAFPRMFPEAEGEYAQVRAMIAEAESTADSVVRLQRYAEIEKYLHEQALVLPVSRTWGQIHEHIRNTVRGYAPKLYGGSTYSSVWLDQSAR